MSVNSNYQMNSIKVFTVAETGTPFFIYKLPSDSLNAGALRAAFSPTCHVDHDNSDALLNVDLCVYLEPGDYLLNPKFLSVYGVTVETGSPPPTNPSTGGNCTQM